MRRSHTQILAAATIIISIIAGILANAISLPAGIKTNAWLLLIIAVVIWIVIALLSNIAQNSSTGTRTLYSSSRPPRRGGVSRRIVIEGLAVLAGVAVGGGIGLLIPRLKFSGNPSGPNIQGYVASTPVVPTATPTAPSSSGGLTWSDNQLISGVMSNLSPALAVWLDTLYLIFVDTNNNNDNLTLITSQDGLHWTHGLHIGQLSARSPTLAVWNNTLYVVFVAGDGSTGLLLVSSQDGMTWTDHQSIGQFSHRAPALTVWNDALYLAFGEDNFIGDGSILIVSSKDGANWTDNQVIRGIASNLAPALVGWNNTLYVAFVDTSNDNNLLLVSSKDGTTWTGSQQIGQSSKAAPALVVWNDTLYLIFVANNDGNELLVISSKDGLNWTDSQTIGQDTFFGSGSQASSTTPALAVLNNSLYGVFVANDSSNNLLLVSSKG